LTVKIGIAERYKDGFTFIQRDKMAYTEKFQNMANVARGRVEEVLPEHVDLLIANGAIALDIRDQQEHDIDHIHGSLNISRGKLEMLVEGQIPDIDSTILCYCNAINRGALSADTLRSMGYSNAKFIVGGLIAYRALG
jgi:phage shock protein E